MSLPADVRLAAEESRLRLASMPAVECLRVAAMLREVSMPRLATARQREIAEESAKRFERRAIAQSLPSRA